jgi:hypothetical protein
MRSSLHELYKFFHDFGFAGIIISGTGLSMEIVKTAVGSISAKQMDASYRPKIFTDTGVFMEGASQENYVRRYLNLSDENVSDRRLLGRIRHWFVGRCVFRSGSFNLLLRYKFIVTALQPASWSS